MTVWSSTQVPYVARAGVAYTLGIPESHVRVDRAAPRRRLRREVRLPLRGPRRRARARRAAAGEARLLPPRGVLRRRPPPRGNGDRARRRGARSDGTLLARRARLVLDGGAYCGEGGFFAQMAAMHALGPYVLETADIESSLVYSNNQPSSSIRAPTAPQVCWALEQHMDELAEALGLDPIELRRRTLIEEGSVTATGQVLERISMKETLERAVELIGPADGLPDDEAIGVACGWWPCFPANAGRVRQAQPGRHRNDRHGRAGERHRRGDGACRGSSPRSSACGPRTSRSSTRTRTPRPGTSARAARRRRSTAAAPCSPPRPRCASSCSTRHPTSSRRRATTSSWSAAPSA